MRHPAAPRADAPARPASGAGRSSRRWRAARIRSPIGQVRCALGAPGLWRTIARGAPADPPVPGRAAPRAAGGAAANGALYLVAVGAGDPPRGDPGAAPPAAPPDVAPAAPGGGQGAPLADAASAAGSFEDVPLHSPRAPGAGPAPGSPDPGARLRLDSCAPQRSQPCPGPTREVTLPARAAATRAQWGRQLLVCVAAAPEGTRPGPRQVAGAQG